MSGTTVITDTEVATPTTRAIAPLEGARVGLWHRWHVGALLWHIVLGVLFTWPLVLNFLPGAGTTVPGFMREDRDQNLWNLWWTRDALLSGQNPFVTDMIWYPSGVSLNYHTLNVFNGLLATPLMTVFSLHTTYNIVVLFSFVMTGYGAFLLVHYICGNRWAAMVGSVVFAYSAYHIGTMRSLMQLISLEWVPFFLLFFLMAVFAPAWKSRRDLARWLLTRALPAGFFLFLASLVDWYYTMYSVMLAGLVGLYVVGRFLWRRIRSSDDTGVTRGLVEPVLRMVTCLAVYVVLVSPILVPTLRELRGTNYMRPAPDAALQHSADLMVFLMPMRGHQLWGDYFLGRDNWRFGADRYETYFTYTALFLAGVALFATRVARPRLAPNGGQQAADDLPGKWFWAAGVVLFFLLALGPVLQVNGQQIMSLFSGLVPLVMPYSLIENLPVLNISRSPDRFDMPLTLCLAILTGYGVNVLMNTWLKGWSVRRRGAELSVGFVALLALELFPFPYPQLKSDIPRWFYQLGEEQGDFSILEMPPQDDFWHGAYRMYYQTAHGKHIFGGYISREYFHPFLTSTPGYQELTYVDGAGDIFAADPQLWFGALAKYKTRYIVLEKNRLPHRVDPPVDVTAARDAIRRVLGEDARPYYEDEQLEVYRVPLPERDLPIPSVGDGWEPREVGPNGSFRWMHDEATVQIDSPAATEAYLTFRATGLGPPKHLQIFHGNTLVFDQEVSALQEYRTDGPLGIPQGISTLTFRSPDGTISPSELGMGDDPRRLSFAILDAKLDPVP